VPLISIVFGLLLIALGAGGFVATGSEHYTALIPSPFGLVLLLLGLVALREGLRKHAMHAAAAVGLFGVLGAIIAILLPIVRGRGIGAHVGFGVKLAMGLLCLVFVGLCVNSFVQARRRRAAASQVAIRQ